MKPPAIREEYDDIEIDVKRGEWPFVKAFRMDDGSLGLMVDMNEGGAVIGEGRGVAAVRLGRKKARRLREFLERTEDL